MQRLATSLWDDAKVLAKEEEPHLIYLSTIRGIFVCSPSKDFISRLVQLVLGHDEPVHECSSARCRYGVIFGMETWKEMKRFATSIDDDWGLGKEGKNIIVEPCDFLPLSTIAYFREVILNAKRIPHHSYDVGWKYENFLHPLPSVRQLAGEFWLIHWQQKQGILPKPVEVPRQLQIPIRKSVVPAPPELTGRARRKAIREQRIKTIRDQKTDEQLIEESWGSFARANDGLKIPTERVVASYSGRESERRLKRIGE